MYRRNPRIRYVLRRLDPGCTRWFIGGIAGALVLALTLGGCALGTYDGPSCKPHTPNCRQASDEGAAIWIPAWYWLALNRTQTPGRPGTTPDVSGKQPTAAEEESQGATKAQANSQQNSQADYTASDNDESSQGRAASNSGSGDDDDDSGSSSGGSGDDEVSGGASSGGDE